MSRVVVVLVVCALFLVFTKKAQSKNDFAVSRGRINNNDMENVESEAMTKKQSAFCIYNRCRRRSSSKRQVSYSSIDLFAFFHGQTSS